MLTHMLLIPEDLSIQTVLLDVLHARFDLAFALRVISFTGVYPESGCRRIRMEALVQRQLPVLFVDHHQLGLIVNTLLGQATKVPHRLIMELDKKLGVQRAKYHS